MQIRELARHMIVRGDVLDATAQLDPVQPEALQRAPDVGEPDHR
jgi:hypothetical protein